MQVLNVILSKTLDLLNKLYYIYPESKNNIMLQGMLTYTIDKGGNYNTTSIAKNQLEKLLDVGLITKNLQDELWESFVKKIPDIERNFPTVANGIIPLMICPNPNIIPFENLFKRIDLGGNSQQNTFFLKNEHIEDMWNELPENTLGYTACNIETGIKLETSEHTLVKHPHENVIHQQEHSSAHLLFYECLLLAFYYPDILDVWDGIQSLGSYYGKDRHTLRLYWLNQKPYRYAKVAREDSPLVFDDRFVSPITSERICF